MKYSKELHQQTRGILENVPSSLCYENLAKLLEYIPLFLDEIERLQKREAWAECLENQGVDNWGGYVDALEEFNTISFDS